MTKKFWLRLVFWTCVLVPVCAMAVLLWHDKVVLHVPVQEIQHRLDAQLPWRAQHMWVTYTVSQVNLDFQDQGRVGFQSQVHVTFPGESLEGELIASGNLSYSQGAFFLKNIEISEWKPHHSKISNLWQTLPVRLKQVLIQETPDIIARSMNAHLDNHPVYVLSTSDTRHSLARLAIRSVTVTKDTLMVTLDPAHVVLRLLSYLALGLMGVAGAIAVMLVISQGGTGLGWLFLLQ